MFVEVSLLDGSSAYLPAELVYLSRPAADLPPVGHATSSGWRAASLPEAVLGTARGVERA